MGLGGWSLLEEYDYNLLKFRNIFDFLLHISLGLVFGGFIVFSMSFTGCLGALRENLLLIKLVSDNWSFFNAKNWQKFIFLVFINVIAVIHCRSDPV